MTAPQPTIRTLLATIRQEIKRSRQSDGGANPWISERLSRSTHEACAILGVAIRNPPAVGGGYLVGIGQWRYEDSRGQGLSPWRQL